MSTHRSFTPIETAYNGYRFRSRLEARWAVYFDAVGLAYEYEPQGFALPSGEPYLPDFWLPGVRSWAEVKPADLSPAEAWHSAELTLETEAPCVLLVGPPAPTPYDLLVPGPYWADHRHHERWPLPDGVELCDAKVDAEYVDEQRFFVCTGGDDFESLDAIVNAVQAARSARFEYGASGAPTAAARRRVDPLWWTRAPTPADFEQARRLAARRAHEQPAATGDGG